MASRTIYEASAHAFPFLAEALVSPLSSLRREIAELMVLIMNGQGYWDVHADLSAELFRRHSRLTVEEHLDGQNTTLKHELERERLIKSAVDKAAKETLPMLAWFLDDADPSIRAGVPMVLGGTNNSRSQYADVLRSAAEIEMDDEVEEVILQTLAGHPLGDHLEPELTVRPIFGPPEPPFLTQIQQSSSTRSTDGIVAEARDIQGFESHIHASSWKLRTLNHTLIFTAYVNLSILLIVLVRFVSLRFSYSKTFEHLSFERFLLIIALVPLAVFTIALLEGLKFRSLTAATTGSHSSNGAPQAVADESESRGR